MYQLNEIYFLSTMQSIAALGKIFEDYVAESRLGTKPRTLYSPTEYIMARGGKRMRPVLLLASAYIFSDNINRSLPAALAVEIFHNFTLIHDDIMDEAATRRGKETVHQKFGLNTAILAGDVMLIRSFDLVMQSAPEDKVRRVFNILADAATEICEGQQYDMDFEKLDEISTDDYLEMCTKKTAVLLGASMEIGAIISGADDSQARVLFEAGLELGRAFQIQDDILDAYGDEHATGKKRGGDIINSKKTYLYTTMVESLSTPKRRMFIDLYNGPADNPEVKIQKVLAWFDDFNIRSRAEERQSVLYNIGIEALQSIAAPESRKVMLIDFVNSLVRRQS